MGNPLAPQQVSVPSSSTTNQTQMYSPNPQAAADINNVLGRAQGVANLPYVPYAGELGAPVNQQQNLGISGVNQYAGWGQPYLQAAGAAATQGATPITSNDIQNWMNPYTKNVTDALGQQFALQNAQGLNQLQGNAASQNALGGDRVGLAQAQYLSNQQVNQSPIMANALMQNYQQAVAAAQAAKNQQFQGAYSLGNVGTAGQNLALQGAGAQIGAGTLEQNTQQLLDQLNLQQFNQGQAFPYQQTSWLAGLTGGLAPSLGGTTTGTGNTQGFQTQLGPSYATQLAGLGMAGIGAYGMYKNAAGGGRVGYDVGGVPGAPYGGVGGPYGGVAGFIPQAPQMNIQRPPPAQLSLTPNMPSQPQSMAGTGNEIADNALKIAKTFSQMSRKPSAGYYGGSPEDNPNLVPIDDGEARGGFIRGFAPGGDVTFDDRFSGGDTFDDRFAPATAGVAGSLVPDNYDIYSPKQDRWEPEKAGPPEPYGPMSPLSIARAPLFDEMQSNPRLANRLMRLTEAEVGGQGPEARRAFLETVFNRALARGQPLSYAANDPNYYPGVSLRGRDMSDEDAQDFSGALGELRSGANRTREATGNASGTVGFAGGPRTLSMGPGKENFGREGSDVPWSEAMAFTGDPSGVVPAKYAGVPSIITGDQDGEAGGVGKTALNYGYTGTMPRAGISGSERIEKPDPYMALMAAGFGTMAGTSPWGLSNIGSGGLHGLQQYASDVQRINQNRRIDLEAQRLQETANLHANTLFTSQERNRLQKEKIEQDNWVPSMNDKGEQVLINKRTGESKPLTPQKTVTAPDTKAPDRTTSDPSKMRVAGEVPEHVTWLANGPFDYSLGDKIPSEIPQGANIPPPQPVGKNSSQSVETAAANYLLQGPKALPPTRAGKSPIAMQQQAYRVAVENYGNAKAQSLGMTPEQLAQTWQTAPKLAQWMVSRDGQTTVSLGTAFRHLNLLEELGNAYYNKGGTHDSQTWNRIKAKIAAEFGDKDVTAANAAAQYSGGEIVKAIVGVGGGGVGERLANEENFRIGGGMTKEQFHANIQAAKGFIAEQLQGKENVAVRSLGMSSDRFKNMIGDDAYNGLKAAHTPVTQATDKPKTVTQGSHTYTLQPDGTYK